MNILRTLEIAGSTRLIFMQSIERKKYYTAVARQCNPGTGHTLRQIGAMRKPKGPAADNPVSQKPAI